MLPGRYRQSSQTLISFSRREAVASSQGARAQVGIESVIILRNVGVAAAQRKAFAETLLERKDTAIIGSAVPRAEPVHLGQTTTAVGDARVKRKVRFANAKDVDDIFMVIVQAHDPIGGDLALNAKIVASGVRCREAWINCDRETARLEDVERESAKRTPKKERARHADGGVSCRQEGVGS